MLQAARYLLGSAGASRFSSKSTAEEVTAACPDIGSLTAIITGATSGIGAETAWVLAKRGARVVIPTRSVKAAEDMPARILVECPCFLDRSATVGGVLERDKVAGFLDRSATVGATLERVEGGGSEPGARGCRQEPLVLATSRRAGGFVAAFLGL